VATLPVSAALQVAAFNATGNPGEWTFTNATYSNQADRTGNGAADVKAGFVVYVPSTDANTATPIPGTLHRYKLTAVTVIDAATLSGTILWNEAGQEGTEVPTNGVGCAICEPSPKGGYGFIPDDAVYPNLFQGSTAQAIQTDTWAVTDPAYSGGGAEAIYKTTIGDNTTLSFSVTHNLGTEDVTVTVYDLTTGEDVYPGVTRTSTTVVRLDFTAAPATASHRVLIRA